VQARIRDSVEGGIQMQQYLLSIYQPDGPVPAPDELGKIMQHLDQLNEEMRAAGALGGLGS
jgi:hypothetical protein